MNLKINTVVISVVVAEQVLWVQLCIHLKNEIYPVLIQIDKSVVCENHDNLGTVHTAVFSYQD